MFRSGSGRPRKYEPRLKPFFVEPPVFGPEPEDETLCMKCYKYPEEEILYHLLRPGVKVIPFGPHDTPCLGYKVDKPLRLCRGCYWDVRMHATHQSRYWEGPRELEQSTDIDRPFTDFYGPGWARRMREAEDRLPAFAYENYRDARRQDADDQADQEYARNFNR